VTGQEVALDHAWLQLLFQQRGSSRLPLGEWRNSSSHYANPGRVRQFPRHPQLKVVSTIGSHYILNWRIEHLGIID
jgi:hypothetical protein